MAHFFVKFFFFLFLLSLLSVYYFLSYIIYIYIFLYVLSFSFSDFFLILENVELQPSNWCSHNFREIARFLLSLQVIYISLDVFPDIVFFQNVKHNSRQDYVLHSSRSSLLLFFNQSVSPLLPFEAN